MTMETPHQPMMTMERADGDDIQRWLRLCIAMTMAFPSRKALSFGLGAVLLTSFLLLAHSVANNAKARSAGELAALFTWAQKKCFDGHVREGVTDALEAYRALNFEAYNAGFVGGLGKLESVHKAVDRVTACNLFVNPYREVIITRSIGTGLWVPIMPEPAWEASSDR